MNWNEPSVNYKKMNCMKGGKNRQFCPFSMTVLLHSLVRLVENEPKTKEKKAQQHLFAFLVSYCCVVYYNYFL